MSVSGRVTWKRLPYARTGFKFRRQYAIGPYVLDFYCAEARLCIEVDGEQHLERREQDAARDAFLAERGILTYRFPSRELFEPQNTSILEILGEIQALCVERTGRTAFPDS